MARPIPALEEARRDPGFVAFASAMRRLPWALRMLVLGALWLLAGVAYLWRLATFRSSAFI